jgi:hypothetical protein
MKQQLLRWSGLDAKVPNATQGRGFFTPIHIRIDISAERVRAVFFKTAEVEAADFDVKAPALLDALIASSDSLPASTYSFANELWSGEWLSPDLAGIKIQFLGVSTLKRTNSFLGSAERDGPGIYVLALSEKGVPLAPFNVYEQSYQSKRDLRFARAMSADMWPVLVAVPHTGAAFDECSFLVRNSAECHFSSNLESWTQLDEAPPVGVMSHCLPTLKVLTPSVSMAADTSTVVDVQVVDAEGVLYPHGEQTIFLEETGGVLPLRRVKSVGGLASFRVSSAGMQSGESFKVKVGFRNISGCDEVLVFVV